MMRATEIEERYRLPFWDALIHAVASQIEAGILLTEEFSHDQEIEGIRIVNPFL